MTGWTKVLLATCGLGMLVTMAAWPLAAQEGEREREVREQKRSEDREAAERVEEREGRERGGAERRERAEAEERERGGDRERAGRERDGREREGRGRRISDGQRVENAVGELRKRLEQLKAQGRELANTDKEDAKHEVARAIEQTQERIEGLIRGFRARQAEREGREGREGEGRRPSREREREHERERPGERERFEMVARAAELLEEAGLADLSHAVRQQLERMHRRGDGERREGREHQERERAEGRPVTLGHLREMREFIGKLHERVEDLSNRVEELEGVLEEAEEREREGGEEPEGDSP